MKKIFLILFILISLNSLAQYPVRNWGRNMLSDTSRFFILRGTDTAFRVSKQAGWKFFTSVSLTKDSVAIQSTNGSRNMLVYDTIGLRIERMPLPLSGSGTLNFPSTAAQTSSDLTITVTGAVDGDAVVIGVPNGSTLSNGCFTAWVSAPNTVTIRFTNNSAGPLDPASGTFRATVFK